MVAALLGLTLVYQLWWCYLGREQDVRAEHSLAAMPAQERARAALSAFGWAHAGIGPVRWRVIGAVLALATVPIGLWLAIAQVAALVVVFGALLAVEEKQQA